MKSTALFIALALVAASCASQESTETFGSAAATDSELTSEMAPAAPETAPADKAPAVTEKKTKTTKKKNKSKTGG